jgi:hypothetical protein
MDKNTKLNISITLMCLLFIWIIVSLFAAYEATTRTLPENPEEYIISMHYFSYREKVIIFTDIKIKVDDEYVFVDGFNVCTDDTSQYSFPGLVSYLNRSRWRFCPIDDYQTLISNAPFEYIDIIFVLTAVISCWFITAKNALVKSPSHIVTTKRSISNLIFQIIV